MSFHAQKVCAAHLDLTRGRFECDLWVNQLYVRVLLDSESMVTLVDTRVAGEVGSSSKNPRVVCIQRDTKD